MRAQSLHWCLTLCDPMDFSPPGSSVHRILLAKILEWVAMPSSRVSSWPRDWTQRRMQKTGGEISLISQLCIWIPLEIVSSHLENWKTHTVGPEWPRGTVTGKRISNPLKETESPVGKHKSITHHFFCMGTKWAIVAL